MRMLNGRIDIDHETGLFIHAELSSLAKSHVDNSNGTMGLIDYDPITYPFQHEYFHHGMPEPTSTVRAAAGFLKAEYPVLEDSLQTPHNSSILNSSAELLQSGKNIILATNHSEITDVGFAAAAAIAALRERSDDFRTGISIGKVVTAMSHVLKVEDITAQKPVVEALDILCDHVFLSFPKTAKMNSSRIADKAAHVVKKNNSRMRKSVADQFDLGRLMLSVAVSGGTDIKRGSDIIMQPITEGTAAMCMHKDTYVIPAPIWMGKDKTAFDLIALPKQIKSKKQLDEMMYDMADYLGENIPQHSFVYQPSTV